MKVRPDVFSPLNLSDLYITDHRNHGDHGASLAIYDAEAADIRDILRPNWPTLLADASTSSTAMYVIQCGGTSAAILSGIRHIRTQSPLVGIANSVSLISALCRTSSNS